MITPKKFNEWRIFPRIIAFFMAYMWIQFNEYFFSIPIQEQSEWALGQYGIVTATFVGFAKFYMDTPKKTNNQYYQNNRSRGRANEYDDHNDDEPFYRNR